MTFSRTQSAEASHQRAQELIDAHDVHGLANALGTLRHLNLDVATFLIVNDYACDVIAGIEAFHPDTHRSIAHMLINSGEVNPLLSLIDDFEGLNHFEVAERIIDSGKGGLLVAQIETLRDLSVNEKAQIIDRLVSEGWGEEITDDEIAATFEDIESDLIELGPRGTGTQMRAFVTKFSYIDTSDTNSPELKTRTVLQINAGCVNFSGATPEETVQAVKDNMLLPNRPKQWHGLTAEEFDHHFADVNEACNIALIRARSFGG